MRTYIHVSSANNTQGGKCRLCFASKIAVSAKRNTVSEKVFADI